MKYDKTQMKMKRVKDKNAGRFLSVPCCSIQNGWEFLLLFLSFGAKWYKKYHLSCEKFGVNEANEARSGIGSF